MELRQLMDKKCLVIDRSEDVWAAQESVTKQDLSDAYLLMKKSLLVFWFFTLLQIFQVKMETNGADANTAKLPYVRHIYHPNKNKNSQCDKQ